ncbi:S1 family peptidase [Urbifossiella limnaea]|uniref:Serine protease n=1 Tax=Urbifossiella limnaea TaxID=2528023 RepID=A0A517XWN4_9BACT|nr:serine protease [Urbifossiella limnaea]QDU21915.1 hypothetical protein ETAA1_38880 [Urbifossiella limnaea]
MIVPGGLVLTAAHCIDLDGAGGMALGDRCIERARTADGKNLLLSVLAAEPVADVAALGAPDAPDLPEEAEAAAALLAATEPVQLFRGEFEPKDVVEGYGPVSWALPVFILGPDGEWIAATATVVGENEPTALFAAERPVRGGASGGPVVTQDGLLVGLVSSSHEAAAGDEGERPLYHGKIVRPLLALPVWLVSTLRTARGVPNRLRV